MSYAAKTGPLLAELRRLMQNTKYVPNKLHAYLVPTGDAHKNEILANRDNRREFMSGFTGSFGNAIITLNEAALWTDGRYYSQASQQLDCNWTLMKQGLPSTLSEEEWLIQVLPKESRVGVDPFLLTFEEWTNYSKKLNKASLSLVAVQDNLVDILWTSYNRPSVHQPPLITLPIEYTGKTIKEKLSDIRQKMQTANCDALLVTALDDVAWLLNMRGSDIENNPVFFAYAIVTYDCLYIFTEIERISGEIFYHIQSQSATDVKLEPYDNVSQLLRSICESVGGQIWVGIECSYALVDIIPEAKRHVSMSPIAVMKAIKNDIELEGIKNAHIRDAAALCEFYAWLETEVKTNTVTEISAADVLEQYRQEQDDFVSLSFSTISGSGKNGAIIHYRPTEATNREITDKELFLCDSGAQFRDGTTDVTRTVHLGIPTHYEQECFTRVLKGHISLCRIIFPNGTKGHTLDAFARQSLWEAGLDYRHGTGHGVGTFLNVHEGPHGIGSRPRKHDVALQANMVVTDEPGYYEDGAFGIRIENVLAVVRANTKYNFGEVGFLTFEPVTLMPIQKKMLAPHLLSEEDVAWLNDYHQLCRERVGALLQQQGKTKAMKWLLRETEVMG